MVLCKKPKKKKHIFYTYEFVAGGEQFELSLKIWLCGGRILETACSRIGHIDRPFRSATFAHINYDFISTVCVLDL